ncbi:glycosyltransferase family 2 protein, partial [Providencia rettgeri]|uniref:glycosyltransferase n=1 Tax=Providencia rettgeri TaxID=587 RepID=UPI001EFC996B
NKIEIIVVDDASTISLPELEITQLIYHRMPINGGPGPARMKGIELSSADWVLILDDDDVLKVGAVKYLAECLPLLEKSDYPVYQFAVNSQNQKEKFRLVTYDDYINKVIKGEFTPVFDRNNFLSTGLQYPHCFVGGEHLLWWKLSEKFGIPSYNYQLVSVSKDAIIRLTHFSSQIANAAHHQQLAEMTLIDFGDKLRCAYPNEYRRVCLAHITYSLLSNYKTKARLSLKNAPFSRKLKLILWVISLLPHKIIQKIFLLYRHYQR